MEAALWIIAGLLLVIALQLTFWERTRIDLTDIELTLERIAEELEAQTPPTAIELLREEERRERSEDD